MNASRSLSDSRSALVRRLLTALLLAAALVLAIAAETTVLAFAASAAPAPAARRYVLRGERVAIYNVAGRMEVVAGTGGNVVVEVALGGRDAGRLRVETGPLRGQSTLRVIYPDRRVVYRELPGGTRTSVRVRDDGTFGDRERPREVLSSLFGDRHTLSVRSSGSGLEAHADLRVLVPPGQRLDVHVAAGEASVTGVDGEILVDGSCSPVTVDGVRGSLTVDVGSGEVDVRNIAGDLDLDTGSGGVRVSGIKGGRIRLDTGSGEVEGDALEGETLLVDTGSGGVRLGGVSAPDIKVDTGSGAVRLDLTSDVRSLVVDTGSGGVTLGIPRSLGAEIVVDTGSGGIHSDVPLELIERDHSSLRGRIGDGRGRILIDTGSGAVRLRGV